MKNTFSISFYARNSKTNKDGLVHLELGINVNQKRLFINLPFMVEPNKFNGKRRPKDYDDYISLMRNRVNQILVEMVQHQEPITADRIREYIRFGGFKSYTVEDLFNDYLFVLSKRKLAYGVYRKYELVKELYLQDNKGSDEVTAITTHTISQFQSKLYSKYESSTAAGYMTKMKTFVIYAINNGKMEINPFNGIKITKENKPIEYLTEAEIETLFKTRLGNKSLENVLDLFLFQASSGLSYADIVELTKEDIQTDGEGHFFIQKKRVKTGTEYTAFILPMGIKILEKYNYNLNVISNQKMNSYLHIIEKQIGFKKSLHSHLARHSYCTLLLNKGVRLEVVSKAAGHRNTKITQTFYAHLHNQTIINEVASAFQF